jgi:para-aminobenzoate synthetase/4-amino-4-deoxychorismate lyase
VRLLVDACGAATATAASLADAPPPARVALAAERRPLQGDPFVRHKTTRRTVYEEARAAHPEADDVLLVNGAGEVTESTIANLVVDLDGRLITPPLAAGLLPGVYRAELLEQGRVREGTLTPRDVRRADAVYLVNSVRGMWPVTVVG